jgi:hypothetical protein
MPNNLTEYRRFQINAFYYHAAGGLVPTVVVSKHRLSGVTELRLSLTCPEHGFEKESEAFGAGFDYAKAAIDGRIPGIVMSSL